MRKVRRSRRIQTAGLGDPALQWAVALTCCLVAVCGVSASVTADPVVVFSDDFETALSGWTLDGTPDWYTGTPKSGSHSVRFLKHEGMTRTISTDGYEGIVVRLYLGAANLTRVDEGFSASWYDGASWTVLRQIYAGDPENDGQLHYFEFALPSTADDNPAFALDFHLTGKGGGGDSGFVDDVVVLGSPKLCALVVGTAGGGSVRADGELHALPWAGTAPLGSSVTLEAVPDACHVFSAWSGDIATTQNPTTVLVDGDKAVDANFAVSQYALIITGDGGGSIEVDGIPQTLPYESVFDCGTTANVLAVPATGYQFHAWSGDVTGPANPIGVYIDSDKSVGVSFGKVRYTLSLTGANGRVSVDGLPCDLPWSGEYEYGTVVTLEPLADDCWRFEGWSGDCSSSEPPAAVLMDGNKSIVANFVSKVVFADVGCEHWAVSEVAACYYEGVVGGFPDATYKPTVIVTRDQMAVYVSRAISGGDGFVPTPAAQISFPDVPADYWAFRYVEFAKSQGVVQGYPDGEYKPTLPLDRGQMAVFVARSIATPEELTGYLPPTVPTFPDVPTDFWAFTYIEYIAQDAMGVTRGYPDGLYHPEYPCTRDQMAVYVARAFQLPL